MVQTSDRRSRTRASRREAFLDATRQLIEEQGIDAVTVKAVAERVDAAVGTLYTYFPSKGALVAALQVQAIDRLGATYERAATWLDGELAAQGVDVDIAVLARLVAVGRFLIAVSDVLPEEFRLQQRLLSARADYGDHDLAVVAPVAFDVLSRPERLLREAVALKLLDDGDTFDRTIALVAGINGVLTLASVTWPDADGMSPASLADMLHMSVLRGWGADPGALAAAEKLIPLDLMAAVLNGDR